LVDGWNHGRIEQGARLDRIFHCKACADQHAPTVADRHIDGNVMFDSLEVLEEYSVSVRMDRPEIALQVGD
jgi:hypothetical protein